MIVVCGLPNAGKTTYSAKYSNIIHFDSISHRNPDEQFKKCSRLVADAKEDICVEGVYNSKKRRRELLDVCKRQKKVCIWIDTPIEECIKRENRDRPSSLVEHHAKIFEPPTLDEGWDEIIRIREGEVIERWQKDQPNH